MNPSRDLPSTEAVLRFLQENPGFLAQYPELLSPAEETEGNVVDFQQLMVQKLRRDKKNVEERHRMLIDNARSNMTIQSRIHAAILRLMEADTLEEMAESITGELPLMLEVDAVTLVLETSAVLPKSLTTQIRIVDPGMVDQWLGDRDSLLEANVPGDPRLFGPAARLVKSQALLRLNIAQNQPDGMLVFGSRDPLLFTDGLGTELVGFLADAAERLVRRFLYVHRS